MGTNKNKKQKIIRLANWEKWSESDLLIWTFLSENNPKIKHNMSPYSFYLDGTTTKKKKKKIKPSCLQKLDYWLWQCLLCLFMPIKLLELNWKRQMSQKRWDNMLSTRNQWLAELILGQKLHQLLGGSHHSGRRPCAAEAASRVSGGHSQVAGAWQCGKE